MSTTQKKAPKGTKITKEFTFQLSDSDRLKLLDISANLSAELIEMNIRFEELKDSHKAKIKAAEAKRDDALATAYSKKRTSTADAIMVREFESKEIQYWVLDEEAKVWKLVERRAMNAAELQMDLEDATVKGGKAKLNQPLSLGETSKRARGLKQKLQKPTLTPNGQIDPVAAAHAETETKANGKFEDIADVHRLETKRGSKTSAVDGPTRN